MEQEKRKVGVFFEVDGKKFVTEIDYRSKGKFEKLIEGFSENAHVYTPVDSEEFKYVPLCEVLTTAHDQLEEKQRANKLILTIMAQNSCKFTN